MNFDVLEKADGVDLGVTGDVISDMALFHRKYKFNQEPLTPAKIVNRLEFLEEELFETEKAAYEFDAERVVDGLIDLMVVTAGTLDLLIGHRNTQRAWTKVMTANRKKVVGTNDSRPNSEGMDLVKPDGWTAPDLTTEAAPLRGLFNEFNTEQMQEMVDLMQKSPLSAALEQQLTRIRDHVGRSVTEVKDYSITQLPTGLRHIVNGVEGPQPPEPPPDRSAVKVLEECAAVIRKKSADYQRGGSTVTAADYYPRGLDDLIYMVDVLKRFRMVSLVDALRNGDGDPENESLRDTLIDRINYLAIAVEWLDGDTPGQNLTLDEFNREECA